MKENGARGILDGAHPSASAHTLDVAAPCAVA